jgi:flagellar protein FlbD
VITVHRLNGSVFTVNAELIETVEANAAETLIVLATGNRLRVTESVDEVVRQIIAYRKTVYAGAVYVPEFLREGSEHQVVDPLRKVSGERR